jgi:hypothetical protein
MHVTQVDLPPQSAVANLYMPANLADAFAIQLPMDASSDPEVLARFLFSNQPSWISALMIVRDAIVAPFGLKTASHLASQSGDIEAKRIGLFKIYSTSQTEIILGEDDEHLNFRVSLLCALERGPQAGRTLTASTVVQCHNLLGRLYIVVISPFHRAVVKASLRRAAHIGWPKASS